MIQTFFNATVNAIQTEEQELNLLFATNKDLYKNHHHGVCNLYETTFVYLVMKELLKQNYSFTCYWEYPYPNNNAYHSDLAILDHEGELKALVEFKLWTQEHDRVIKSDILKLQKVHGYKKYILIIGYGGDIEENSEFLLKENSPSLKLVDKKGLLTKYFRSNLKMLVDSELNIFMYEVL